MSVRVTSIAAIGFAIAAMLLAGCGSDREERAPVVRPVKTVVVGEGFMGRRSLPGRVEASERVELSFRVPGSLMMLDIDRGQQVSRGQLLARIDPRDYKIALDEARAAFAKAESDFKRYQSLYEKNAVSISDLDLYRSQRDVARARLDNAEANLDYTYLRAPFAGVIGDRYVENFEDVLANQVICSLHDLTNLDIVVDVPEQMIVNVRRSAETQIEVVATFDAAGDREFPVTFREVAAQADPTTQTYEVRLTMPGPEDLNILPGMTAEVVARGTRDQAGAGGFLVPASSVFADETGTTQYVWVVDPDGMTVHRREVAVSEVTGAGSIGITGGLEAGERIVVAGVSHLEEGKEVRLMEE
jgi:RND family efflux transporter MFP subunit